jgi:hypothetical protein
MRRLGRLVPAVLVVAALTGCGDDEQPAGGPPADSTRLTVEVTGAGADPVTVELSCGGSEPCDERRLARLQRVTEPPDPSQACTLVYGGPEEAHVTGTLDGEAVDVTIDRADGCGIADYKALFEALGRKPPLAG